MNLKTIGCSTLAVAAALTTATINTVPAQAAAITAGSVLNLSSPGVTGGGVKLISPNTLDFFSLTNPVNGNTSGQRTSVDASTGSFQNANVFSLVLPLPQIQDLGLTATANPNIFTQGVFSNFITGVDIANDSGGVDSVSFDLTSFTYNKTTGDALFSGVFKSGTFSIAGEGRFTSQLELTGAAPSSYSMSITAVPTPALLPGLIGLGVAAMRKRKAAMAEEAGAEA